MSDFIESTDTYPRKVVAFRVGEQEFCLDIMAVREIQCWAPATPLPQSPSYVRGVINLRGCVLPIVDLAARFGFPRVEPTSQHVIIVTQIGQRTVGLLVDGVSDIVTINEEAIQATPDVGQDAAGVFVRGIFVIDGRMIGLVCLEEISPPTERYAA